VCGIKRPLLGFVFAFALFLGHAQLLSIGAILPYLWRCLTKGKCAHLSFEQRADSWQQTAASGSCQQEVSLS